MKKLIVVIALASASLAHAHGRAEYGSDGTVYIYPDAQGRFDAALPTDQGIDEPLPTRDAERARRFLAGVYESQGTVWEPSNPVMRFNQTVMPASCNCTVYGVPR